MRSLTLSCMTALASLTLASVATQSLAQTASESQQSSLLSNISFSANVGVVSQYRYRGIMQTNNKPAIQGGFDLEHASGLYLGNWNSSISWLDDSADDVSAPVEMDFYGGYKANITADLTFDVGVLHYYYPGDYPDGYTSPNTTEAYVGFGYGPLSLKYSHAFSNLFGVPDSKNSQYVELNGSFDTGVWGLMLDAHVGHQRVRNLDDGSYTDWSVGVSKDWGSGFVTSLAYIDTNADRDVYTNSHGRYTGRATALLSLRKSF